MIVSFQLFLNLTYQSCNLKANCLLIILLKPFVINTISKFYIYQKITNLFSLLLFLHSYKFSYKFTKLYV